MPNDKKIKIFWKDGRVEVKEYDLQYSGTATESCIYTLETLQIVFGEAKGMQMCNEQNERLGIYGVKYV